MVGMSRNNNLAIWQKVYKTNILYVLTICERSFRYYFIALVSPSTSFNLKYYVS
jgi:hypothetical protein